MVRSAISERCGKTGMVTKWVFLLAAAGVWILAVTYGCSSNSNSMEIPKDFIQEFIAKHETMVDKSLVYFYTKEDQEAVTQQIEMACRINKAKGILESLENANFDFSELKIEVLDKKEEYKNDEPVVYVKVAVKGCYKMQLPEEIKEIKANEVIILQMARNEWKVANSNNPWS